MKRPAMFALFLAVLIVRIHANEGMWTPEQLPALGAELKSLGLAIDPSKLTSLTEYPMNAVVSLGGCTASFVSPDGLIVTNHHCAYSSIQHNSTKDNNLLQKGFLAKSLGEELPAAPGSRVYVTVEFRDVSEAVLGDLSPDLSGKERFDEIDRRQKLMVAECEKEPNIRCRVASYFGGLRYSLVRQLEIRDVRLVYAPAEGIGVFGGDIDNWMWPRHTGDYSFFRAYVGQGGGSADFSKDNIPYRPKHYLQVSTEGVREGDLVLVAGYPGSTDRYRLACEVESAFQWSYPHRIRMYQDWLEIINRETENDPDAAIRYASLVASLNNVLKNNRGMMDGFARSDMLEKKIRLEAELSAWLNADPGRQAAYASAVNGLLAELNRVKETRDRDFYYSGANRSALLRAAKQIYRLSREKQKPDIERESGYQERDVARIRQAMERIERTFDPAVDQAVWEHFILEYHRQLPAGSRIPEFDQWFGLKPGQEAGKSVEKKLNEMYRKTGITSVEQRLALLDANPWELEDSKDPFIRMAIHLFDADMRLEEAEKLHEGRLQLLRPRYMEALIAFLEKEKSQEVYPDANGTLRVTYGTIKGYHPRDAVIYEPFTTLEGVAEKDTGEEPFRTPPNALEEMKEGNYGRWASPVLDTVLVNFLSTCDTTGGNSGSPTLNNRGELVGLLFDGNYESMIADWDYIPSITRSIHVDMLYVLWVMDIVDQAHHLMREMGIEPGASKP